MSITKPEIETHSAPQGVVITDAIIDKFAKQMGDKLNERLDMWEERLGSKIDKMEARVSLLAGSYQDRTDSLCRDDGGGGGGRGYYPGHADFASFTRISEERRVDGSLIPWSSGS